MITSQFNSSGVSARDSEAVKYIAWIDGVGAWLILTASSVTMGRAGVSASPLLKSSAADGEPDISLVANLSRRHATIDRVEDNYILTAHSGAAIHGRPVRGVSVLPRNCEIRLDNSVRLGFSIPTPLSATATVTFVSDHRSGLLVDGVILMAETCVLGPSGDCHIRCPDWKESIVLVQTSSGLAVKSSQSLAIGRNSESGMHPIPDGKVVSGDGFRFRLESVL